MKDDAIRQSMASIENRVRHVYNQGFEAGRKAERKTGRWITDGCLDKCSCCGVSRDDQLYDNYCGNCGAKMEGAEE